MTAEGVGDTRRTGGREITKVNGKFYSILLYSNVQDSW